MVIDFLNYIWLVCIYTRLLDSEGEGEGGMIWENGNSGMNLLKQQRQARGVAIFDVFCHGRKHQV